MTTERPPRLTGDQRRDQLISAARDVFLRYGLTGARTRTIAEYAGVSEALLYQHFGSKQQLFDAAILEPLERLTETLAAQCLELPSLAGPQRRATSVDIHAEILASMTEIAPLLGLALFSGQATGRAFYLDNVDPLLARTRGSFAAALTGWEHAEVSPDTLVSLIFGTYFWVAVRATFTDERPDHRKLAADVTDLLVRAMTVPR